MPVDYSIRSTVYVAPWGQTAAPDNAVGAPQAWRTLALALADLAAIYPAATALAPHVVAIEPGTYTTPAFALPPFTFVVCNPDGAPSGDGVVILSITGNITLAAGWSVNATKSGGFIGVAIRPTSTQIVDLTMPTPASGNPARKVFLTGVTTDTDSLSWEATSTADALVVTTCVQDGAVSDNVEFSGGSVNIRGLIANGIVTLNDTATIALAAQVQGIFRPNATAGTICASTGAGSVIVLGGCTNRNLTLAETAPGAITVSADAISIPLVANLSFTGTATNADLVRLTDSGGIVPAAGGINGGANPASLNAGNATYTPDAHNYFVRQNIGGAAGPRTSILIASVAGSPAPVLGDIMEFVGTMDPAATSVTLEWRNATAGGTLLESFVTDGVTAQFEVTLEFNGTAWTLWGQSTFV